MEKVDDLKMGSTIDTEPMPAIDIPHRINFYWGLKHFWLGRHENEKLFAASFGLAMFGRTIMTLYDGPTKHDPVIVTSTHKGSGYAITVANGPTPVTVKRSKVRGDRTEYHVKRRAAGRYALMACTADLKVEGSDRNSDSDSDSDRGSDKDMEKHSDAASSDGRPSLDEANLEWRRSGHSCTGSWELLGEGRTLASVGTHGMSRTKTAMFAFVDEQWADGLSHEWKWTVLLSGLLLWNKDYQNFIAAVS